MFWHNEEYSMGLGKDIYLDGVVCLVDAVYGRRVGPFCSRHEGNDLSSIPCSKSKKMTLVRDKEKALGGVRRSSDSVLNLQVFIPDR
jgi:hypothetical protein